MPHYKPITVICLVNCCSTLFLLGVFSVFRAIFTARHVLRTTLRCFATSICSARTVVGHECSNPNRLCWVKWRYEKSNRSAAGCCKLSVLPDLPFSSGYCISRTSVCCTCFIFPRCMECRRGLAMRILSVCLSVCLL